MTHLAPELQELQPRIKQARQRIIDSIDTGVTSPSFEARVRTSGHRDVADKLNDKGGTRFDPAKAALKQLHSTINKIQRLHESGRTYAYQLADLEQILNLYAPSRKTQAHHARSTPTPNDGCVSCARAKNSQGEPLWTPRHGNYLRCRWCIETVRRIRSRRNYKNIKDVPVVVITWRETHNKRLSETDLDRLLKTKTRAR